MRIVLLFLTMLLCTLFYARAAVADFEADMEKVGRVIDIFKDAKEAFRDRDGDSSSYSNSSSFSSNNSFGKSRTSFSKGSSPIDQTDERYLKEAFKQGMSARLNKTISWRNPGTGHKGSVTLIREGRCDVTDKLCRELEFIFIVEDVIETANMVLCQDNDHKWEMM